MRDADAARITAILQRYASGDRDRVFAEASMNRDLCGLSNCGSRFDEEIEGVVVCCKRRDFRAVVPGQVFPVPAGAVLWSNEVTLVADDIAFNALYARGDNARREIVDCFEVVAAVETCRDRWIAATVDRQVAVHDGRSIRRRVGVDGCRETIVG